MKAEEEHTSTIRPADKGTNSQIQQITEETPLFENDPVIPNNLENVSQFRKMFVVTLCLVTITLEGINMSMPGPFFPRLAKNKGKYAENIQEWFFPKNRLNIKQNMSLKYFMKPPVVYVYFNPQNSTIDDIICTQYFLFSGRLASIFHGQLLCCITSAYWNKKKTSFKECDWRAPPSFDAQCGKRLNVV